MATHWFNTSRMIFRLSQCPINYHTKLLEYNHSRVISVSWPKEPGAMMDNALTGRTAFITPK